MFQLVPQPNNLPQDHKARQEAMRRQDLQLRTLARQGDAKARLKLGQLYLAGSEGTTRNLGTGLSYLRGPANTLDTVAATTIASALRLEEILEHGQLDALEIASEASAHGQVKLAVWRLVMGEHTQAVELLQRAADAGAPILEAWQQHSDGSRLGAALRTAAAAYPMDVAAVASRGASIALLRNDLSRLLDVLAASVHEGDFPGELHGAVVAAVRLAEASGRALGDLQIQHIQAALEQLAAQGDQDACWLLGRALSGLHCGLLPWERLVEGKNLRKGSAMLLRAADAGNAQAWLALYRISSDYRCSVANPQLARFCLEKAARAGETEAERRLGAVSMREADCLADVEAALELLFRASSKGDGHAAALLSSLVLRLQGVDSEAFALIADVEVVDPWLAMRLRLARHFGLTKQEALSVNPAAGIRPWGLVVGQNPFIAQSRLSAPRAVPALTPQALACAASAAKFFANEYQDHQSIEGPLRKRSLSQRRLFQRLNLHEGMFFASASSCDRDALRIGSRWAHRARELLKGALAEQFA